jgi:hypothetical protein
MAAINKQQVCDVTTEVATFAIVRSILEGP